MTRGLRAQLSPNEENALRKIASGSDGQGILLSHLTRLAALWLIESRNGKWELTDFGRTRIEPKQSGRTLQPSA